MLEMRNFNLKEQVEEITEKGEKAVDAMMIATGMSPMKMMTEMDEKTGAAIGCAMSLYKDLKNYAISQAEIMDYLVEHVQNLELMNDRLLKQNEYLQTLLQEKK